ncbi:MAG: membrane dipeptidase [Saprospiraceae bacterium]|nr:membrane dipeptidase [Saprospiraceae bacterium]
MKKLTFYFLFLSLSFFAKAQNYGDIVKIKHVLTNTHLHSHAIHYGHPQSSGQQQVTAFGGADDNDYWVIKSEHGNNNRSGSVRHGDVIRLEHYLTRRNLHSHAGIPSPVTGQQEVTCFGENGNGDSNDNWRIEIDGGDTWAANRRIRLIHINTNHALHSHAGHAHPQWTAGQQEVTGFGGRDDNDWWVLTELRVQWESFPGQGRDIGVGANGAVWHLGWANAPGGHPIFKREGAEWQQVEGGAARIDVDPQGNAWVVNSDGLIYKWTGSFWQNIGGQGRDIGIGADGTVWLIGWNQVPGGYTIHRWNGSYWQDIPGGAAKIDVDPQGNAWVTNDQGNIFKWNGSSWEDVPGQARDITISAEGSVWCIGWGDQPGGSFIYKWVNNQWLQVNGGLQHISAGNSGNVWGINAEGGIWQIPAVFISIVPNWTFQLFNLATVYSNEDFQGTSVGIISANGAQSLAELGISSIGSLEVTWGYKVVIKGKRPAKGRNGLTENYTKEYFRSQKNNLPRNITSISIEPYTQYGFADFHTHPAAHLAFGDPGDGHTLFWGKPGLSIWDVNPASLASDLPPCGHNEHSWDDGDIARKTSRATIINTLTFANTNYIHATGGYPNFLGWPNGRSGGIHQQMHVKWLYRAYQGGLRLIVASTVDNQTLATLWRQQYNPPGWGDICGGTPFNRIFPDADYISAKKQLEFIRNFEIANQDWMKVCLTSSEAKKTIQEGKLAVVLGTEMDGLTPEQLEDLIRNHGVRCVTPIHLANNGFGGCAVYSDVFNNNNRFLNGNFCEVVGDAALDFRLSQGGTKIIKCQGGGIMPEDIKTEEYANLGYDAIPADQGHRNKLGADMQAIKRLMRLGVIIDIAHMSQQSQEDIINFSDKPDGPHYPVINTHTGIRDDQHGHSERSMKQSHFERIKALGGVIGLGLGGSFTKQTIFTGINGIVNNYNGITPIRVNCNFDLNASIKVLELIIESGNGLSTVDFLVKLGFNNGQQLLFSNLNMGADILNNSKCIFYLPLPENFTGVLSDFTIQHTNSSGTILDFSPNRWDISNLELNAIDSDPIGNWTSGYAELNTSGKGIGLGSDFNGLDVVFPFTTQNTNFPTNYDRSTGLKLDPLSQCAEGNKLFDFKTDGLAHIGMYPDMMQLISQSNNGEPVLKTLFRSTYDFVEMWSKSEQAASKIRD